MKEQVDITKLSTKELEELLAKRKKEERKQQDAKRKDYEAKRDYFIAACIAKAAVLASELQELKKEVIVRGNDLHDTMFEVFDKEPKELKTFSLINEEGTMRVELDSVDKQSLDETSEVHIETIKTVLKEKFEVRNKTMYGMLNDILIKNTKGDYDERLVAKLRKWEAAVDDERFSQALDGLSQAYYTYGTATYARFYTKDAEAKKWNHINIQFSSL